MHPKRIASVLTGPLAVAAIGCSARLLPALPDPDVDLGLGDVVLLTWTTRSHEGILGHAMLPNQIGVDPHRRVVDGPVRWVDTSQRMRFLYARQDFAKGGVNAYAVGAAAKAGLVTHVAYDVHLTRYLELPPSGLHYSALSGCCLGGEPTSSCGEGYVVRMMWGSGTVQYLQQVAVDAQVSATGLLQAEGGTAYRRLNEMTFDDSFFAYEAVPLAELCNTVPPEEEIAELTVQAPKNCWGLAQRRDGTREASAFHLSDSQSCREVVSNLCRRTTDLMNCHMTFGTGDGTQRAEIPASEWGATSLPLPGPGTSSTAPTTSSPW